LIKDFQRKIFLFGICASRFHHKIRRFRLVGQNIFSAFRQSPAMQPENSRFSIKKKSPEIFIDITYRLRLLNYPA
jgi:hypothetical protein